MKLRTIILLIISILITTITFSQDIASQLIGKTFSRDFYALVFKHTASYTFYKDRVVYQVHGFFVNEKYSIIGTYQKDKFIGKNSETGDKVILFIKILSPNKIAINKIGYDSRYKDILKNKPVQGWHEYVLKK